MEKKAQLNLIYKSQFVYQNNDFKPVCSEVVTNISKTAKVTLKEEEKFLFYIEAEKLSSEMVSVCET